MPKSAAESEWLSQKFGQRSGLEEDAVGRALDDAHRRLGRTGKTASQIHFEEIARMW